MKHCATCICIVSRYWREIGAFILRGVSKEFVVHENKILRRTRYKEELEPRHRAMWLMRLTGMPLKQIGALMNRDHTTVIYGIRKVDKETPPDVEADTESCLWFLLRGAGFDCEHGREAEEGNVLSDSAERFVWSGLRDASEERQVVRDSDALRRARDARRAKALAQGA